jgi:hypothetical protein
VRVVMPAHNNEIALEVICAGNTVALRLAIAAL